MPSCRVKECRALRKRAGGKHFRCCCSVQPEASASASTARLEWHERITLQLTS